MIFFADEAIFIYVKQMKMSNKFSDLALIAQMADMPTAASEHSHAAKANTDMRKTRLDAPFYGAMKKSLKKVAEIFGGYPENVYLCRRKSPVLGCKRGNRRS